MHKHHYGRVVDAATEKRVKLKQVYSGATNEFFRDLENAIAEAKDSIYISNWTISYDFTLDQKRFCDLLLDAAHRGVNIHIAKWNNYFRNTNNDLYKNPHQFIKLLEQRNRQRFRQASLPDNLHIVQGAPDNTSSFHDKLFVCDDKAFVGSIDPAWGRRELLDFPLDNRPGNPSGANFFSVHDTTTRLPRAEFAVQVQGDVTELKQAVLDNMVDAAGTGCLSWFRKMSSCIYRKQGVIHTDVEPPIAQDACSEDDDSITMEVCRTRPKTRDFSVKDTYLKKFRNIQENEKLFITSQYLTADDSFFETLVNNLVEKNAHAFITLPLIPENYFFAPTVHTIRWRQAQVRRKMEAKIREMGKDPRNYLTFLNLANWNGKKKLKDPFKARSKLRRLKFWGASFESDKDRKFDAKVEKIKFDPRRQCRVATLSYPKRPGIKKYMLAPWGLREGQNLSRESSQYSEDLNYKDGDRLKLSHITIGSQINFIDDSNINELKPYDKYLIALTKQVGCTAKIVEHLDGKTKIRVNGYDLDINSNCCATLGTINKTNALQEKVSSVSQGRSQVYVHGKYMWGMSSKGTYLISGSANLNTRSLQTDTETVVVLNDSPDKGDLKDKLKDDLKLYFGEELFLYLEVNNFFDHEKEALEQRQKSIKQIQDHARGNWGNYIANDTGRDSKKGFIVMPPGPQELDYSTSSCCPFRRQRQTEEAERYLPDTPPNIQCDATRLHPKSGPRAPVRVFCSTFAI